MAKEVFISYSSVNADEANALCTAIEATGISCWIAPRDIAPGADWSEGILAGIHECRVFVLVLTAHSNASPQVRREVERAVNKDLPIIAFRRENVTLTPALEYFISTSHWFDATLHPLEDHLPLLSQAVHRALKSPDSLPFTGGAASWPPAAVAAKPAVIPVGNLPTHSTVFVGREREVQQVQTRLDEGARLVTLTGLGGIGKTRIALKVAGDRKQQYSDGTWWIDLSVIQEPVRALTVAAATLGMPEEPDKTLQEQLVQYLNPREILLVLDSFEHIIAAAEYLDALLHACPRLTLLVTSRAPLNISSEYEVAVRELSSEEAVSLFCMRAQQVKSSFTLDEKSSKSVEAICRHLDRIPLAIELAATQIRMLGVGQLEKQLKQRFRMLVSPYKDVTQRQRTLKAAIDWSYDLLTPQNQQIFAQLSIFCREFTLEDAEAVCPEEDVYFGLAALREQSLLRLEETEETTRFSMLQTLREYGREKLQAANTLEAVSERHAVYYAEVARQEGRRLRETGDAAAFARLSSEVDNLRAALDWLWKAERVDAAAELTVNLRRFWERKGWFREGETYLEQAIKQIDRLSDPITSARVLRATGWFAYLRGDYATAETLTQRSLDTGMQAGVLDIQASALSNLGFIAQAQRHPERAETLMEQSVAIYRQLGNEEGIADLLTNLGTLQYALGNRERSRQHFEEARNIYERRSDVKGVAVWLCNQSDVALQQGNWTEAEAFADESLQRFRLVDDPIGIACTLANKAAAAARQDKHDSVDSAVSEAISLCLEINLRFLIPNLLETQVRSQTVRGMTGIAITSLVAAQRLRTLLDLLPSPEEKSELAQLETQLRQDNRDPLFRSAEANYAGASVEEILAQLFSLR